MLVPVLTPPPRGWAGLWPPLRPHGGTPAFFPLGQRGCSGGTALARVGAPWSAHMLACSRLSGSHQQEPGRWVTGHLESSPSEPPPPHMCFHSLSLQGSDLPSKTTTSTFFFCILINTEEARAVKLYLGENLRTGLSGVVEPLTAFNTQLVINCFVYLFSVFISTNKHCNYSY